MRTLVLAALAASSIHSAADACGVVDEFEPQAFAIIHSYGAPMRTFVSLHAATAPDGARWEPLSLHTYDSTQIADAPALTGEMTVTLVGPDGARIVASHSLAYLQRSWEKAGTRLALEVAPGNFHAAIALAGRHADARWIAAESRIATNADRAWVAERGARGNDAYVTRLPGGVDLITATTPQDLSVTFVRDADGNELGRAEGHAFGAVRVAGRQFALVGTATAMRSLEIGTY